MKRLIIGLLIIFAFACTKEVTVKKSTVMNVKRSAPHKIEVITDGEVVFTQTGEMELDIKGIQCSTE